MKNRPVTVPLRIRFLNWRGHERERVAHLPHHAIRAIRAYGLHALLHGASLMHIKADALKAMCRNEFEALEHACPFALPLRFNAAPWTAPDLRALSKPYSTINGNENRFAFLGAVADLYHAARPAGHPQAAREALCAAASFTTLAAMSEQIAPGEPQPETEVLHAPQGIH